MSKNTRSGGLASPNEMCYMVSNFQISNLEGKILTLVESLGLKDTQEKAAKDLFRQAVWEAISNCIYIESDLQQKVWDRRNARQASNMTTPATIAK